MCFSHYLQQPNGFRKFACLYPDFGHFFQVPIVDWGEEGGTKNTRCFMPKMFCEGKVGLRTLEPDDVSLLYAWECETDAWQSNNTSAPYSRRLLREYLCNYDADIYKTREVRLMVECDGQPIGTLDVFNFDPLNSRAEIGLYVAPQFRRLGIADKAIAIAVEQYAFGVLSLNQVYATIRVDNAAALAAFTKAGFSKSAVLGRWISVGKGRYADAVIMQRMAD